MNEYLSGKKLIRFVNDDFENDGMCTFWEKLQSWQH